MEKAQIRHIELFAGVGGFRQALETLGKDWNVQQDTVAFSESDQHAIKTYKTVFDVGNEVEMGDISAFCADPEQIRSLPESDLVTAGFPCQPFSMMGAQKGFDDDRGSMIEFVLQILRIRRPQFVILENVRNLAAHDSGRTLQYITDALRRCGYPSVLYDVFDTAEYGLAQRRNRVYILASREKLPSAFVFTHDAVKSVFDRIVQRTSLPQQSSTHEILERSVDQKYYLSERIKPTILANGSGGFVARSTINDRIAKPLTSTMAKMHRACQDNYYSDGYIQSKNPDAYRQIAFTAEELAQQPIRKLTPREAFRLQGFSEQYITRLLSAGVSNTQLYRQAGNAVSVNTAYAILYYLFSWGHQACAV